MRVDVGRVRASFEQSFAQVWAGTIENDGFNRLVLGAGLGWREIVVLRAYAKYLLQTRVPFSQSYMEETLARHAAITGRLAALFVARFDPDHPDAARCEQLAEGIEAALEAVAVLDEDRILRRFLAVILATLRTNFYQTSQPGQPGTDGGPKEYLSFKFDPAKIPELPLPRPMYEIWVYSPRADAIHLRGGKVARGGITASASSARCNCTRTAVRCTGDSQACSGCEWIQAPAAAGHGAFLSPLLLVNNKPFRF